MRFKFGTTNIEGTIPDQNVLQVIEPSHAEVRPYDILVKESLMNPIGKSRLKTMLRKNRPGDVVIIVSDRTRTIAHYAEILSLLVSELVDAGVDERNIECVVALGTHRPHTDEESQHLYKALVQSLRFSNHDCYKSLISIGKTSTGLEVLINERAHSADLVIATGKIDFHYMAGFSGGRKAVLPGIAAYETIRSNHSKLRRDGVIQAKMDGNIIAREMNEASQMFGLDYIVNVVETPGHETCAVFCGEPYHAFKEGVAFFKKQRLVKVARTADCAIVSAGGTPRDRDFYVGHKVLNNVLPVLKPGGAIVFIAQCTQGIGNKAFFKLLQDRTVDDLLSVPEDAIEIGGHRAFQTARLLHKHKVYVVSDLEIEQVSNMKFIAVANINTALDQVRKDKGDNFACYIIPDGTTVMPVVNGTE